MIRYTLCVYRLKDSVSSSLLVRVKLTMTFGAARLLLLPSAACACWSANLVPHNLGNNLMLERLTIACGDELGSCSKHSEGLMSWLCRVNIAGVGPKLRWLIIILLPQSQM
jgi:hypothetical protein